MNGPYFTTVQHLLCKLSLNHLLSSWRTPRSSEVAGFLTTPLQRYGWFMPEAPPAGASSWHCPRRAVEPLSRSSSSLLLPAPSQLLPYSISCFLWHKQPCKIADLWKAVVFSRYCYFHKQSGGLVLNWQRIQTHQVYKWILTLRRGSRAGRGTWKTSSVCL